MATQSAVVPTAEAATAEAAAASAIAGAASVLETRRGKGHTAGRRRILVDEGSQRDFEAPDAPSAGIRMRSDGLLGFYRAMEQREVRGLVRRASKEFLLRSEPIYSQDSNGLRRAIESMDHAEPRLARCCASWGACSLISRSLIYCSRSDNDAARLGRGSGVSLGRDRAQGGQGGGPKLS